MRRGASVMWVGLMVTVAVITYAMKDSAGRAADHVMQLRTDIAREKEALTVLRAEWGVLDQPARLQSLVERYSSYLNLKALDVRQLATIADVPERLTPPPEAALDALRTGSIATSTKPAVPKASTPKTASPRTTEHKPVSSKTVAPVRPAASKASNPPMREKPAAPPSRPVYEQVQPGGLE